MIEILLAIALGVVIGIATGLLPGLHPNNMIPIMLGFSFLFEPLTAAVILLVSGVVNSFLNFIPAVLFGAPDDSNVLSVLPGHKLFREGRGLEAIKVSVFGGLGGVVFAIISLPLFALFIPQLYALLRPYMHWILILVVAFMLYKENRKLFAFGVFILSGILGYVALNFSNDLIFPLLSGLFGLPTLLLSYKSKTSVPKVRIEDNDIAIKKLLPAASVGSVAGIVAGLLPAIGSAQATLLTQSVFRENKDDGRSFLTSIGAVTVSDIIYSILALWLIGNPRSGIAVAIGKLLTINFDVVLVFLSVILISAGIGAIAALKLSKKFLDLLTKINYSKFSLYIFISTLLLVVLFTGILGLIVALSALLIGLIPNYVTIKRTNCMGCLLLPTILFFMGI